MRASEAGSANNASVKSLGAIRGSERILRFPDRLEFRLSLLAEGDFRLAALRRAPLVLLDDLLLLLLALLVLRSCEELLRRERPPSRGEHDLLEELLRRERRPSRGDDLLED